MSVTSRKIFGYFGHHKCASEWFGDIFGEISYDLGIRYRIVYKDRDFFGDLKKYVSDNKVEFIAYGNADYNHVAKLDHLVGIHAVRDPRDIIVSAYFSHLKTHSTQNWPELQAYRLKLQQCDQETGLFQEIAFRREEFEEMRSWKDYHGDNIMVLRVEDVTTRSYQSILSIMDFFGLLSRERFGYSRRIEYLIAKAPRILEHRLRVRFPRILRALPAERILGIVWNNEFEQKSGGRKVGEENKESHYRKGVHGDWKNYLTKDHVALIKQYYNDVIIMYGYEKSADWHM